MDDYERRASDAESLIMKLQQRLDAMSISTNLTNTTTSNNNNNNNNSHPSEVQGKLNFYFLLDYFLYFHHFISY
jgi:hypothetical protein